jgi:hypothetical protein
MVDIPDVLGCFVPFAGNQHDIAHGRLRHSESDCHRAVNLN